MYETCFYRFYRYLNMDYTFIEQVREGNNDNVLSVVVLRIYVLWFHRYLKMDHTFIKQVREGNSDNVLCVVQGVCKVEKDAEIKRVTDITGDLHVEGKVYITVCLDMFQDCSVQTWAEIKHVWHTRRKDTDRWSSIVLWKINLDTTVFVTTSQMKMNWLHSMEDKPRCGTSEAKRHIGITLSVVPSSVCPSVCMSCFAFAGISCIPQNTVFLAPAKQSAT